MPKITGTNLEKLEKTFRKKGKLTVKQIKSMFPNANPLSMVWQLKYRKGLVFNQINEERKVIGYEFVPCMRGPTFQGSKREFEERTKRKKRTETEEPTPIS